MNADENLSKEKESVQPRPANLDEKGLMRFADIADIEEEPIRKKRSGTPSKLLESEWRLPL
jgi:hypothetical protein